MVAYQRVQRQKSQSRRGGSWAAGKGKGKVERAFSFAMEGMRIVELGDQASHDEAD